MATVLQFHLGAARLLRRQPEPCSHQSTSILTQVFSKQHEAACISTGAPKTKSHSKVGGSLTVICLHIKPQAQVVFVVQKPMAAGCGHIKHQPAFSASQEILKIQEKQVWFPREGENKTTEAQAAKSRPPSRLLVRNIQTKTLFLSCYTRGQLFCAL